MTYKLLWQDEFLKDGQPDDSIWTIETGGHGFGNNEDQFYTAQEKNAYVKDGMLHIVAIKEAYEHRNYTSAKLITKGKKSVGYGKLEVMAKLPKGHGTWPAIWLLGDNIKEVGWPMCGEIDLMEHVGKNPDHIHFSLHSKNYNHHIGNQPTYVFNENKFIDEFHLYQMIWDEKSISFYLDDKHMVTFEKGQKKTDADWPFDQSFYLILNLAIGGWWGGDIDDSMFPVEMLVKYVKVYERCD